jgi:arginase
MEDIQDDFITYKFLRNRIVGLVGVSIKEGQDLDGPELAPQYIREAGLFEVIKSLGWSYEDYGDIKEPLKNEENIKNEILEDKNKYKYHDMRNALELGKYNRKLYETTKEMSKKGQFALTLGGDHGLASGSISGLKETYPDLKVIWIDAHADCNTPETSSSGNYHGMPVAHLLGWMGDKTVPGFDWFSPCLTNKDIVFIGLRDIDPEEKKNLKKYGIKCFTMHDVLRLGIGEVMKQTLSYLSQDGENHPLHVSFDIDGCDPSIAYGTGTKSRGGIQYREAHYILREAAATERLVGMDMVEINPLLDIPNEHFHGDNKHIRGTQTVAFGISLIASTLGDYLL